MGEFDAPFSGAAKVRAGRLTRYSLAAGNQRIFQGVYVCKTVTVDARIRAEVAFVFSGGRAVVGGKSAAALLGVRWVDPSEPAELIWRARRVAHPTIRIRTDVLRADEVTTVRGIKVTTPARTAFDLGRRLLGDAAIVMLDALVGATGISVDDVTVTADKHPRARGSVLLRSALALVDGGAESPQETRTRLLLVRAGLPVPTTQIEIRNAAGRVIFRLDIGWEKWKVALEYDGVQHWHDERQRTRDIERFEEIDEYGWLLVRVNSEQLRLRPFEILERVRAKLRSRGAPV